MKKEQYNVAVVGATGAVGEQMREVDRATIEAGTPETALMERAGRRVAAIIKREFHPLKKQRVVASPRTTEGGDFSEKPKTRVTDEDKSEDDEATDEQEE